MPDETPPVVHPSRIDVELVDLEIDGVHDGPFLGGNLEGRTCLFASLASRRRQLIQDASDSKHGETQRHSTAERNLMAMMRLGKSPAMRREPPEAAQ